MKIVPLFLDEKNPITGKSIKKSGQKFLWSERCSGLIDVIVIHYISAVEVLPQKPYDKNAILQIFCDYGVSSHFLIDREGSVMNLVPVEKKAWHCGGSIMPEPDRRTGVNDFSIGIELMATQKSGFTLAQYRSLCKLSLNLEKQFNKRFTYLGHEHVAGEDAVALGLRKDIKPDPGNKFNWERFFNCLEEGR